MTKRVDLSEFVEAFLGEAEELLRTLSASLLAADADAKRGRPSPRAVRDAFRATHTLKGLAGMVAIEPIVALAHGMEPVLRAADRAGAPLAPQGVDALLRAAREIERRVEAVGRGEAAAAPPPALVGELDSLERPAGPGTAGPPARLALDDAVAAKLGPLEHEQLARAVAEGGRVLRVDFTPSPARAAEGLHITSVRERVSRVGEIVKVIPRAVPPSDDAPGGLSFTLVVVPSGSDAEVAAAAGVPPESLVALSTHAAPPPLEPEETGEGEGGARAGVVRVDVARLDEAMDRSSALVVTRLRMANAIARLGAHGADVRELSAILAEQGRQLRDLRAAILRVRMVPVAEMLERIPLLVRGLRRATGKAVRVEMDARDVELDKAVAERVFPAVVHLVRNAVDHAIEPAAERRAAGKPDEGTIAISCFARAGRLELTVRDDGAGVDAASVAARAGAAAPQSDAALLDLLCRPGLSTRAAATATSGRGMGMDIVRRVAVEELGGDLALENRPGAGAAFTLRVPLTVAIVDSFSFEAAGQRFVVPVAAVEEILELDRARDVRPPAPGGHAVALVERRGETVPVVDLDALLGLARAGAPPSRALVVRRGGEPLAFAVDRMLGQQEIVLRPLEDRLAKAPGVAGATDLGDGRPTLVLDLVALGAVAGVSPAARPAAAREARS